MLLFGKSYYEWGYISRFESVRCDVTLFDVSQSFALRNFIIFPSLKRRPGWGNALQKLFTFSGRTPSKKFSSKSFIKNAMHRLTFYGGGVDIDEDYDMTYFWFD